MKPTKQQSRADRIETAVAAHPDASCVLVTVMDAVLVLHDDTVLSVQSATAFADFDGDAGTRTSIEHINWPMYLPADAAGRLLAETLRLAERADIEIAADIARDNGTIVHVTSATFTIETSEGHSRTFILATDT